MATNGRTARKSCLAAAVLALLLRAAPLPAFPPSGGGHPGGNGSYGSASSTITSQTFMYIDAFYVDPKRIVPTALLEGAFRSLEAQYPELIIDSIPDKRSATVRVRGFDKVFNFKRLEGPADVAAALDEVVSFVAGRFGDDVDRTKLLYAAINGALLALDPHTNIFSTKHFKDFKTSTSGSFGGIGFTFNAQDGELTIISPIPDTPASRAGLQSGDRIVFIDGVPTTNMSSDTAVGKMRGEPGTQVTLTIARESWTAPRDFLITREIIQIVSVESHLIKGEDGPPVIYARIKNFQANTSTELAVALGRLETPETAGLILDLRDNPGGLLEEAVKVADGFMDSGAIVSTRNRRGRGKAEEARDSDRAFTRLPLVVLVNRGSASASEIVSGALQDTRAILLGQRTFGKGSVQQAFPLSDGGGVLVTVAQYLTPGDVSIQSIGVEPDVVLEPVLVSPERVQLASVKDKDHGSEAALRNAFSDWGNARREALASVRFLRTEAAVHMNLGIREPRPRELSGEEKAAKTAEEFETRLARRILLEALGKPDRTSRSGLLAAARTVIARVAAEQEQKIVAALGERGLDWTAGGPPPAGVKLAAKFPEGVVVAAGEKTRLTLALTNESPETLRRVWGRTESANPLLRNLDFPFGSIAAGETREWTAEIDVPGGVENRWDTVTLRLQADAAELAAAGAVGAVVTRSRPFPEYAYTYRLSDENLQDKKKSADGRLEAGERARLAVTVTNRGGAESPLLEVNLSADEKEELYLEEVRRKVEKLPAGGTQELPLSFKVVKPQENGRVKVNLVFSDRAAGGVLVDSFEIPTLGRYDAAGSRIPPQIAFSAPPPLVTDAAQVTLAVSVDDDSRVKDVIVYRGEKKLSYNRNREHPTPFPVSVTVPLDAGSNRIVIVARDEKDIQAQKVLYIHRRGGESAVAASKAEPPAGP